MNHVSHYRIYDPETNNTATLTVQFDGLSVQTRAVVHKTQPAVDTFDPHLPENEQCGAMVYWWDGEYEGSCILKQGHEGNHYDGMSWFNDENEQVEQPPQEEEK